MIESIIIGIACGLTALIPGASIGVGLILSQGGEVGLYAIVAGLMLNTVIESISPVYSGNIYTGVYDYKISLNRDRLIKILVKYKIIAWGVGLALGYLLPPIYKTSGLALTLILAAYLISRLGNNWHIGVYWLIGVRVLVDLCKLAHITQPVLVISIVLFILPTYLEGGPRLEITASGNKSILSRISPNWALVILSNLISLGAPGVSPAALTTTMSNKSFMTTYLNTLVVEVIIESFALAQASKGAVLGKALISTVVTLPNVGVIILATSTLLIAGGVALIYYKLVRNWQLKDDYIGILASISGTITLVWYAHWWAPLLVIVGYVINLMFSNKLAESGSKGLTFLALLV